MKMLGGRSTRAVHAAEGSVTPMELGWCLRSIRQICNFAVALHRDRVGSGVRPDVAELQPRTGDFTKSVIGALSIRNGDNAEIKECLLIGGDKRSIR